ncbi:hypothetical protein BC938DRAFT_481478 [Jimgerdemannia flammicorona]|uniref:Uncharacterized protein n=1 Tax=Jimgerdemannia flammicorona TaxID=994334 RepID=A0A433QGQ3_9FUNG|nr:hypothetical protein BC938DRAFT_481478 [Jimgerdemannia flammicorona]
MSLLKNLTAFAYVARVLRPQPVAWRPLVVRLCSQPVATLPPAIVSMAAWPRILGRSYSGQSGQKVYVARQVYLRPTLNPNPICRLCVAIQRYNASKLSQILG